MIISVSKCRIQKDPEDTNCQSDISFEGAPNTSDAVPEHFLTSTSILPSLTELKTQKPT